MRKNIAIFSAAAFAAVLSGCLSGPDFRKPELPQTTPEQFKTDGRVGAIYETEAQWWDAWGDPLLLDLVSEASSTNITVREAQARLRQSRAALSQSEAALWPSLSGSGSAGRTKTFDPSNSSSSYRAGVDAGWEIDLFGKNRRSVEAAEAEAEAAGIAVEDALLSVRAEIARDYVALRLAQEQLRIAVSNLTLQSTSAEIARAKGSSGFTSGSDVSAAESAIASAAASIPAREANVSSAARAIELLLAREPFALDAMLADPADVPMAPPPPAVTPAEALARRPDVRKAEASLHAATARIGQAVAARYPSINISGAATLSASSLSDWSEALKSLTFGPSVSIPIFAGGRLEAAEEQARAAADESLLQWHDAVLGAVHEAQDDWTRLAAENSRGENLQKALAFAEEALEAALERYRQGQGDYSDVLARTSACLSAAEALAQHRADEATLAISLMKALGGPAN